MYIGTYLIQYSVQKIFLCPHLQYLSASSSLSVLQVSPLFISGSFFPVSSYLLLSSPHLSPMFLVFLSLSPPSTQTWQFEFWTVCILVSMTLKVQQMHAFCIAGTAKSCHTTSHTLLWICSKGGFCNSKESSSRHLAGVNARLELGFLYGPSKFLQELPKPWTW